MKTTQITVRVPTETLATIDRMAEEHGRSRADEVRQLIERALSDGQRDLRQEIATQAERTRADLQQIRMEQALLMAQVLKVETSTRAIEAGQKKGLWQRLTQG